MVPFRKATQVTVTGVAYLACISVYDTILMHCLILCFVAIEMVVSV